MNGTLPARSLMEAMGERLALEWVAGRRGTGRMLRHEPDIMGGSALVGHLNLIHPNQIQVIGHDELAYLNGLRRNSRQDVLEQICGESAVMLIVCDGLETPATLTELAETNGVPLLCSALPGDEIINLLRYYLGDRLAETTTVHGVFMEVMGIGVLLTGDSAVGKSELALELVSRGHRLIADDAPEFARIAPDVLRGSCPPVLQDFLEVRGLGILNIRAMYGDSAIKRSKYLRLIIQLRQTEEVDPTTIDRLNGGRRMRDILDVEIPEITLPVAPGRNLAVLVEAAVRNHLLRMKGYLAGEDLADRQRRLIADDIGGGLP
ncbi:MAG: HPr(Ser) kinase/phosphatase [Ectothiorhodospiraceae bacterium]|nr:HPr(Ser) kinase/phosphatase [Ectothiorhodospiraceae bacterium]